MHAYTTPSENIATNIINSILLNRGEKLCIIFIGMSGKKIVIAHFQHSKYITKRMPYQNIFFNKFKIDFFEYMLPIDLRKIARLKILQYFEYLRVYLICKDVRKALLCISNNLFVKINFNYIYQ